LKKLTLFLTLWGSIFLVSCVPSTVATIAVDGTVTVTAGETLYDAILTVLDATLIEGDGCLQVSTDVVCSYIKVDKGATITALVSPTALTACRWSGFTRQPYNPIDYRTTACSVIR